MSKREWFDIQSKVDAAEIFIYSDIGDSFWGESVSASDFKAQLYALKGQVSKVNIRLNSPGGSVFDGVAIYNLLRSFPASVQTQVDGVAASIASIIALAGERVTMAENALMMIHDPWMRSSCVRVRDYWIRSRVRFWKRTCSVRNWMPIRYPS